jgi:hypothetical protein
MNVMRLDAEMIAEKNECEERLFNSLQLLDCMRWYITELYTITKYLGIAGRTPKYQGLVCGGRLAPDV